MTDVAREDIMPGRVARLPRDYRGYPVPWFVQWFDDAPDFRVMDPEKFAAAVRQRRCWVCGDRLGRYSAYTIGPMCAINRINAEPPSHRDCAIYSARACPFLSNPRRTRQDGDHRPLPDDVTEMAGVGLLRNPGVALVWVIEGKARPFKAPNNGGWLFRIGEPLETLWFAHGREATRQEVADAMASGMPTLVEHCRDDPDALMDLERRMEAARPLLPA